ncbi:MAG: T9SS type A sorting domain-containing protein [Bacteroidia bacterium]|nr:T9SS type A sorting domain-containing protein [Bacteroidia bacterium]
MDSTGAVRASSIGSAGSGTSSSWQYNAANLQPGDTFFAVFYDSQGDPIERADYPVHVRKPTWISLSGSQIQLLNESGNTLSLRLVINLADILSNITSIPTTITGIGGRGFTLRGGQINIEADFDMQTGDIQVTTPQPAFALVSGIFGENRPSQSSLSTVITLDPNLNPIIQSSRLIDLASWQKTIQLKEIPLIGVGVVGLNLSASLGFGVEGRGRLQLVTGVQNGQWGFYETAQGDKTEVAARLRAYAFGRGELKGRLLFLSSTLARGEVRATLEIGGTASYYTGSGLTTTFGGEFRVEAEGQFLGYTRSWSYTPSAWGAPLPSLRSRGNLIEQSEYPELTARTYQTSDFLPDEWPMPRMIARDTHTVVVWRDHLSSQGDTRLLLSYYLPSSNSLTAPLVIRQTNQYLSSPSVALLPSGEAVVAWVQASSVDPQAPIENNLAQMNIHLALVNPRQGTILSTLQLPTPAGATGAFEPAIFWGEGNIGLLIWESMVGGEARLYSATLSRSGNSLTASNPILIPGQSNSNYQPHLVFYSANNAYLVWLQSTNSSDYENIALYSVWDGSSWSQPDTLVWMGPGTSITSLSIDEKGEYGAIALTYEYPYSSNLNSLDDDIVISGLAVAYWKADGSFSYFQEEDTTRYIYEKAHVAVSPAGYVTLIVRVKDREEIEDQEEEIEVWAADISQVNPTWQYIGYNPYVSDSTHFVWDMTAQFGDRGGQSVMFLLSEEIDSMGRTQPAYGVRFGAPELHLVLRAVQVSRNAGGISLSPFQTPVVASINSFYDKERSSLLLRPIYPNPAKDLCILPLSLSEPALVKVEIHSLYGKCLLTVLEQELLSGSYEIELEIKSLPSGMYFVVVSANDKRYVQKLVVQ